MAAPYIDNWVSSGKTGTGGIATFSATLPTFSAGDLVMIVARRGNKSLNPGVYAPSGWSELSVGTDGVFVIYRTMDGSESGPLEIYNLAEAHVDRIGAVAACIKDVSEMEFVVGASEDVSPPSITSSWGADVDTLWLSVMAQRRGDDPSSPTYGDYTTDVFYRTSGSTSAAHARVAIAHKAGVGGTQSPQTWDVITSDRLCAAIALRSGGSTSRRRSPLLLTPW